MGGTVKLSLSRAGLAASVISLIIYLIGSPGFAQMPGSRAPDFTLNDVLGNKVSLSSFRGRVTILNFWATWCGPCKAEMPSLNNLYLEFRNRGLAVVAVSIDTTEKPVLSYISQTKPAFPILMDKNKEVYFDDYAGMGLPETFIIDRKGMLIEKIMGEQEWDSPKMKEKILDLLTGR